MLDVQLSAMRLLLASAIAWDYYVNLSHLPATAGYTMVDHGRPMRVEQVGIGWWVNCLRSSGGMVLHVSRSTLIYHKMTCYDDLESRSLY